MHAHSRLHVGQIIRFHCNPPPHTHNTCAHITPHNVPPHRYGPGCNILFDYKISVLVCGGNGPYGSKSIIKKFLEYRKGAACACG